MEKTLSGKIIRRTSGNYEIMPDVSAKSEDCTSCTVFCRAKGAFRFEGQEPLVGDNILIKALDGQNFVIDKILPRKNSLIRPPIANLDFLFVMFAAKSPEPVLSTVDKLISIAEYNKIEPVIIVTKSDIDFQAAQAYASIYRKSGFTVFSAGETESAAEISDFINQNLTGKTAAFAGASGIGKSTLINRLFPDLSLETGEISRKISRGKHTTRSVDLYTVKTASGAGFLADTPGFGILDFERFNFFTNDDLVYTFREFEPYIGKCRYTKCSHTKEENCAVIEAVRTGAIPKERHESFVIMRGELKNKHEWDKKKTKPEGK